MPPTSAMPGRSPSAPLALAGRDEPGSTEGESLDVELATIPSGPLSTQLYATIRERIIRGRYPQGSRLPEQRLASELQVSRIPLREALPQLEADGFIRTLPRRSAVVSTWTSKAVHDLFDARLAVEGAGARLAARRVAEGKPMDFLDEAMRRSDAVMQSGDELTFAESNADFHGSMVTMAGNDLMDSLMRAVTGRMAWLFYLTARRDAATACREHHAIVEAIRAGNERLAEALTYAHIEAGREPSFDAMRTMLDS